MSTTFRSDRVAEAIRAAVTRVLREESNDPGLGFVTITACEVAHDLQHAKIFYTVLGDEEARQSAQSAFERATPFFRTRVGEAIDLRVVPELSFRFDNSTDNAMRIEQLLSTLPELQQDETEEKSKN